MNNKQFTETKNSTYCRPAIADHNLSSTTASSLDIITCGENKHKHEKVVPF